ncbi:hypothetical protein V8C42DRAFT_353042 [Trichoderma barbatum]
MIPMQRSLSSPDCIQSSPPSTPSPDKNNGANSNNSNNNGVDAQRPKRYESRSPSPTPTRSSDIPQTLALRLSDDVPRRGRHPRHQSPMASRKAIVAQPNLPNSSNARHGSNYRPLTPTSSSNETLPGSKYTKKPLLQDTSMYTNTHLVRDSDNTTLEELAHVVRLSKYQERKRANTRIRLQRSLISTALSARLTRCGEMAHRYLVESFRKDDKENFAALYNAIHDVRKSCDELRRYALLEPELDSLSSALGSSESLDTPTNSTVGVVDPLKSITPFLHDISASARETFIEFLTQIRTNPDYLATRICALSSSELNPVESVLPFPTRNPNRPHASASGRSTSNTDIERLLSFQRHDPLSILIHACFANSAGPDSSEDQRRTDIWATSAGEHFLICVLNIWTAMRDWSGKSSMEWYLMKILEDGAFLLDRAEDQHGTRFNLSDWNQSDELAAKEFYDRAVNGLFEMGLLELGNAILSKLENKCLFFVFLLGYHITPYAREKILKKVAMKAHEYVSSMWSGKPSATCVPVNIPPKIKGHVENILARFQGTRSKVPAAKLLPARSITSLRETVEVRPYLVISPADLATLVNALFPEKRPHSARSGPASISGLHHKNSFDTASIISTSASSIMSDATTSRDFIYDLNTATPRYSPPAEDPEEQRRLSKYEDDGYRLRLAIHEMQQNLGADAVRGSSHPCAERWSLSTQMTYDPDDELEDEENSSSTDTDEDETPQRPELDKDYHQLRNSVLKLVEDYEIPRSLEPERLRKYTSRNRIIQPEKTVASRNPYRKQMGVDGTISTTDLTPKEPEESEPVLITMLKAASSQSKAQADFVSAHMYWKTSLRQDGFAALINILARGPRDAIRRSASAIEDQERHEGLIDTMMKRVNAIRDKMWYVTDVRNSKEYAHSRDICQALKTMGMPRRWSSFQRSRAHNNRGPSSSYLYRTESQIMDLLAASEEQGGPNKLSDDQAEMTSMWLHQYGIENFCQGEERIHRFCCEVDRCINKLVGETIREAPVLWSSELYKRDKLVYDRSKARDRDHSWAGDDSTSIISEQDRRHTSSSSGRSSSFARDLRSMTNNNTSHHSLDSSRHSHSRTGGMLADIPDGQEYFDKASPVDSSGTFCSAPSRYSPTTSLTNVSTTFSAPQHHTIPSITSVSTGRPSTAASSNDTIQQHRNDDEKTRFLNELKQTLTSLLLSDLGNQVLARGSETDGWFHKLGQQCIDRKDALERRARRKSDKKSMSKSGVARPRGLEKKRSFGNLRNPSDNTTDRASEPNENSPVASPEPPMATIDPPPVPKETSNEFPFKKAYQRLLNMFCVHPNPYAKLNALNELEQLIIASMMSSGPKRARWNRSDAGSSIVEDHGSNSRPTPLEGMIDNVRERRLQAIQSGLPSTGFSFTSRGSNSETRSIVSGGASNSDLITKELYTLFRDASIRPKSLFRDLQFIAAFVPAAILDRPEKGKAFWNAGLAALKLKSEVCRTMVEMADEVIAAHAHARQSSTDNATPLDAPQSATGTPPPPSTTYGLNDVGKMWTITAKEGYPTAQRELALFYLSNPEYVERTTLPLSKPREVFKQTVMEKYGRTRGSLSGSGAGGLGSLSGGNEGDVRTDPGLMCVAVHWMEAAEQGGDELASSFLRQNEFMGLG